MIAESLRPLVRPIDSVRPDPRNARRHDAVNLAAIRASLTRFGQQKPIVVDRDGVVIAGNGTLAAARALGWTEIAASEFVGDAIAALGFSLADNRTGDLSDFDPDLVVAAIRELDSAGESVAELLATSEQDFASMLAGAMIPASEPDPPDTSPQLGGLIHRVVVDCTDEQDQAAFMARLEAEGRTCRALIS